MATKTPVTTIVEGLRAGTMSTEEAVEQAKSITWAPAEREYPVPQTAEDMLAAAENTDPPTVTPGSFDEIASAHGRGISTEQYTALFNVWCQSQGVTP